MALETSLCHQFVIDNNESIIDNVQNYCPPIVDELGTCWNYTRAGEIAKSPCPNIPFFDATAFAEKECTENATWYYNNKTGRYWSNYIPCLLQKVEIQTIYVFFTGHTISAVFLIVSLWIFHSFKELRCHRITLHKNLFTCYLLNALCWIILHGFTLNPMLIVNTSPVSCFIVFLLATYFNTSTYFWMLSEGVYLAVVLFQSLQMHGKPLMIYCYVIGWGIPSFFCLIYFALRGITEKQIGCWLGKTRLDYILLIPGIITLLINLLIILIILRLLIKKMKRPPSTSEARQWGRRTGKSVFVLVLLLGVQNIFFLYHPSNPTSAIIHEYMSAFLTSFQGVFVSCLLCFANKEIRVGWRRRIYKQRHLLQVTGASGVAVAVQCGLYGHSLGTVSGQTTNRRGTVTMWQHSHNPASNSGTHSSNNAPCLSRRRMTEHQHAVVHHNRRNQCRKNDKCDDYSINNNRRKYRRCNKYLDTQTNIQLVYNKHNSDDMPHDSIASF